jgi:hypothetical protein
MNSSDHMRYLEERERTKVAQKQVIELQRQINEERGYKARQPGAWGRICFVCGDPALCGHREAELFALYATGVVAVE